jgi:hypothetical protein
MIDGALENLALLQEQADPDQGLAIQQPLASASFPKFSLLPAEIRLQIWKESFPAPHFLCRIFIQASKKIRSTHPFQIIGVPPEVTGFPTRY